MRDFKVYQTSGMLNFLVSEASDVRKKEQTLSGDIVSFTAYAQSPIKIVVNIDSIGWTGCEVWRTGVNVYDKSKYYNSTPYRYVHVPLGKSNTLQMSIIDKDPTISASDLFIGFTDTDEPNAENRSFRWVLQGGVIQQTKTNEAAIGTYGKLCEYVFVYPATDDAWNRLNQRYDISVNYPSSDTDYHAYQGNIYSVTFPDSVGTVTDGTLTIDYDGSATLETGGQTYTLTSVSPIETLIGDNNIWADAGPVSVTYPI